MINRVNLTITMKMEIGKMKLNLQKTIAQIKIIQIQNKLSNLKIQIALNNYNKKSKNRRKRIIKILKEIQKLILIIECLRKIKISNLINLIKKFLI